MSVTHKEQSLIFEVREDPHSSAAAQMATTNLEDPKTAIQKRKSGIRFYADEHKTLHTVFSSLITNTLGNTSCICNVYLC